MTDWAWVGLGFGVAYAAIIGYLIVLRRRLGKAYRQIGRPQ